MRGERLALCLVEIEHPDLAPDELRDPDAGMIGLRAGAADVPERSIGQQRIRSELGEATFRSQCRQRRGVVRPRKDASVITFPDVVVLVGHGRGAVLPLLLKGLVPPGIMLPS